LNAILIFYEVMNSSGKDENTDADLKLKVSYQRQMPMIAPNLIFLLVIKNETAIFASRK